MKRKRDFRTPPSLPVETITRCITIPNSQEWLGLVNAALLFLTEAWRYDQVELTDLTREETAARAYQMYVEYLAGCAVACCPLRINPFTGRLQQSTDDGATWGDVINGPWDAGEYPETTMLPPPRAESGDDGKACAAAATAARVLFNLYAEVGDKLLNVVAVTDWDYVSALASILTGFLLIIGMLALQPYIAIAALIAIVGVRQQYVDNPLDEDDEALMTCLLLQHSTVQASGSVTFDFQAVWNDVALPTPKNGLMRFLLTMIGPDALNYAGAVDMGITGDCSACGEWCYTFDFAVANGGWVVDSGYGGVYSAGAWRSTHPSTSELMAIKREFTAAIVTGVTVTYTTGSVANGGYRAIDVYNGGTSEGNVTLNAGTGTFTTSWSGEKTLTKIRVWLDSFQRTGENAVTRVVVHGIGTNPFGDDNCEE